MATTVERMHELWENDLERVGQIFTTDFTSDGSGNYTEVVTMRGWLVLVVFDPGSTAPTDDYDVTLIDASGADMLSGTGANRDTATSERLPAAGGGVTLITYLNGSYTITVANAGSAKVGQIKWYVKNR